MAAQKVLRKWEKKGIEKSRNGGELKAAPKKIYY